MAVTLDQIHFYNPPRPQPRQLIPISANAFDHSLQSPVGSHLGDRQPPNPSSSRLPRVEDDPRLVAEAPPPTAEDEGYNRENAASALVVPITSIASIELPDTSASPTFLAPGDNFQKDDAGRPLFDSVQSGYSAPPIGAESAFDCTSVVSHPAPRPASPASLGPTDRGVGDPRSNKPVSCSMPDVDLLLEEDDEAMDSASSPAAQSGIRASGLDVPQGSFPILSSLPEESRSLILSLMGLEKSGKGAQKATSRRGPTTPPSRLDHGEELSPIRPRPSKDHEGVPALPIEFSPSLCQDRGAPQDTMPGSAIQARQLVCSGDPSGNIPATPLEQRSTYLLSPFEPKSQPNRMRRSQLGDGQVQRRSERLRSALHRPHTYYETSDSSDDASGGEDNYTAGDENDPPAPKRHRTQPSLAEGARSRSRRRQSRSSVDTDNSRTTRVKARARGIISPPTSRDPSEAGSNAGAPVATFQEWPLEGATLKRVKVNGQSTYQLQFSLGQYTETAPTKKLRQAPSKTRGPFTAKEDDLLVRLRQEGNSWKELHEQFTVSYPGRTVGALQVRYCTKLKNRQG